MSYSWRFDVIWDYKEVFLQGIIGTLLLTFLSMFFGLIAGLLLGMGKLSRRRFLRFSSSAFIEVFRDTPVLVQIVWVYYCLPILTGLQLSPFQSAVLALSIQASAYLGEVFRAGIESIDRGQTESARSLGMSHWLAMRRIILPQAVRRMFPPMMNVFADFMKVSALASIIGVWELLRQANNLITTTYRPLEAYTTVAIIYFLLIFPIAFAAPRVERWLSRKAA